MLGSVYPKAEEFISEGWGVYIRRLRSLYPKAKEPEGSFQDLPLQHKVDMQFLLLYYVTDLNTV